MVVRSLEKIHLHVLRNLLRGLFMLGALGLVAAQVISSAAVESLRALNHPSDAERKPFILSISMAEILFI